MENIVLWDTAPIWHHNRLSQIECEMIQWGTCENLSPKYYYILLNKVNSAKRWDFIFGLFWLYICTIVRL